jgi:hypothetical protein
MLLLRIICAACHGFVVAISWMSSCRLSSHPAKEVPMMPQIEYRDMSERFLELQRSGALEIAHLQQ